MPSALDSRLRRHWSLRLFETAQSRRLLLFPGIELGRMKWQLARVRWFLGEGRTCGIRRPRKHLLLPVCYEKSRKCCIFPENKSMFTQATKAGAFRSLCRTTNGGATPNGFFCCLQLIGYVRTYRTAVKIILIRIALILMKYPLLLFFLLLCSLTACKKEDNTGSTGASASWRVNNSRYIADSVVFNFYTDYPNEKYIYAYSSSNGMSTVLRLSLRNVPLDRNSFVGTSLHFDTSIAVAFFVASQPLTGTNYHTQERNTVQASVTVSNGQISISLPDVWLYQYHFSGSYVTRVDSVLFSCNVQIPSGPTAIESPRNYWKLNDTVFNGGVTGMSYPTYLKPNTPYFLSGSGAGTHREMIITFMNAHVIDTPRKPFRIRVGKLFRIQLYSGGSNAHENASYSSADTTDIFATIGSSKYGSTTFAIPEMWLYRRRIDTSGNPVLDSARFSCDIQREGN